LSKSTNDLYPWTRGGPPWGFNYKDRKFTKEQAQQRNDENEARYQAMKKKEQHRHQQNRISVIRSLE